MCFDHLVAFSNHNVGPSSLQPETLNTAILHPLLPEKAVMDHQRSSAWAKKSLNWSRIQWMMD